MPYALFHRYLDIESKLKLENFGVNNLSMLLPNNNFSNLRWFSIDDIYMFAILNIMKTYTNHVN